MKKIFSISYLIKDQEKFVQMEYIPEHISVDEVKLDMFLKEKSLS